MPGRPGRNSPLIAEKAAQPFPYKRKQLSNK
jgi:hypothetical protein